MVKKGVPQTSWLYEILPCFLDPSFDPLTPGGGLAGWAATGGASSSQGEEHPPSASPPLAYLCLTRQGIEWVAERDTLLLSCELRVYIIGGPWVHQKLNNIIFKCIVHCPL